MVALGGAGGATLRHALDTALPAGDGVPWTTFAINVVGSFLLALLPLLLHGRLDTLLVPLLGPGLLGGFTTLSAVSEQTRELIAADRVVLGAAYSLGTAAVCLLAVAAASVLVDRSARPGSER